MTKSYERIRALSVFILKHGSKKQRRKLKRAYSGKRLKKWWSSYASWECCTIVDLKDAEHVGHRMKGGHRHNHVRNATARMRKCKDEQVKSPRNKRYLSKVIMWRPMPEAQEDEK